MTAHVNVEPAVGALEGRGLSASPHRVAESVKALWYAWGRADGGCRLTGRPDTVGGDPAFGFAQAWSRAAEDYRAEKRGWLPSIRDAFTAWQQRREF